MKITRKDILAVFGVLMAVLVAASAHVPESKAIQTGIIQATPEFAFQVKKVTHKFRILVQLKSHFSQTDQR